MPPPPENPRGEEGGREDVGKERAFFFWAGPAWRPWQATGQAGHASFPGPRQPGMQEEEEQEED